jgi:hypothetical protein
MKKVKILYKNEIKEVDDEFAVEMAKMAKLALPKIPIILWLSRHEPLPAQIQFLRQKIPHCAVIQYPYPLSTANDAVKLIQQFQADYVIPVLPLSFIAHLVQESKKHSFIILKAEMELLHNCSTETPFHGYSCPEYVEHMDVVMQSKDMQTEQTIYRHFRFREFVKLVDIIIKTEPF